MFSEYEKVDDKIATTVDQTIQKLIDEIRGLKDDLRNKYPSEIEKILVEEWYVVASIPIEQFFGERQLQELKQLVNIQVVEPLTRHPEVALMGMFNGENAERIQDWKNRYLYKLTGIETFLVDLKTAAINEPQKYIQKRKEGTAINRVLWFIKAVFCWPLKQVEDGDIKSLVINILAGFAVLAIMAIFGCLLSVIF